MMRAWIISELVNPTDPTLGRKLRFATEHEESAKFFFSWMLRNEPQLMPELSLCELVPVPTTNTVNEEVRV
jgi:hypothetical protein